MFLADWPAGQKDAHTEVFKIMHSAGVALDFFDPVVKPFAGGVGWNLFKIQKRILCALFRLYEILGVTPAWLNLKMV